MASSRPPFSRATATSDACLSWRQHPGRNQNWEQSPTGRVTPALTIDPAKNGGERGEVAVKGVNGQIDIEVRYALENGVSGFYTYAEYTHKASYPTAGFGENRFILQMNPTFNWLSVDKIATSL